MCKHVEAFLSNIASRNPNPNVYFALTCSWGAGVYDIAGMIVFLF
jgi:hypothetical protein